MAARKAKFEEKWRRRKFFEILPHVGAFIRGAMATGGGGDQPMMPVAADGAQLGDAEQQPVASGDAAAACGMVCRGGGGSADPAVGVPTPECPPSPQRPHVPAPYVQFWVDAVGRRLSQVYGRCGGCAGACVLPHREEGGRGWLCEDCFEASWDPPSLFGE